MSKYYFIATVLIFFHMSALSQVVQLDSSFPDSRQISRNMACFVDTTAALLLSEVQGKNFHPVKTNNFRLPFSDNAYWYRVTLKNAGADQEKWYLAWDNNTMEQVDFYISEDDTSRPYRQESGGTFVAEGKRKYLGKYPSFAFELADGQQKTIYLRAKSQRGQRVRLILYHGATFFKEQAKINSQGNFISGLIALRLFYMVLLALFAVRERIFRAYSAMLTIRSLGYWGLRGDLGDFLTNTPFVAALVNFNAYHFAPVAYVIVLRALMPHGRFPAYVRYLLHGIVGAVIILSIIIILDYRWYWLLASTWLVLFSQGVVLVLYLVSVIRKYPLDWYYSIPFLMGLVSYFFWQMSLLGILNAPWVYKTSSLLFISEIFVFGLFLGKIIRNYERAKAISQHQLAFTQAQTHKLKELDTLKTNFFANISHEFRTPLTLLVGPLDDFKKKYPSESLIPAMQRNVRRLQSLINQLLDLSKLEAGRLTPRMLYDDLASYLQQTFASFESLAQSRTIIFNYQQSSNHRLACFDPDMVEKIVTNLLSNAFKFTPKGGRVNVRVDYSEKDMILQVKDYGIGMEPARLLHIFDRFYQGESGGQEGYEGTGIGLSIVNELVGVLRGKIWAESEPGLGSTFTVRVPIDEGTWADFLTESRPEEYPLSVKVATEAETTVQDVNVPSPSPAHPAEDTDIPLLLLVEDNPDLRTYMRTFLGEQYRILEAMDGQDGLCQAFEHIPDLVVCDVMMPRLNGFAFCKTLKTDIRTSHIPVVILTAKATLKDRLEGLELGADDYLSKPFNRNELLVRVQNLLKQRNLLQQKYGRDLAKPIAGITENNLSKPDFHFLQSATAVVTKHLTDSSFSVEDFSASMQLSRTQMHRKMKALTNQSSTEFIRTVRVNHAAELLKKHKTTVSEVAYQVGFESLSYFSKVFQEQLGTSPSEWHSRHQAAK
jgi:signal transduction histidine kinase/DNA-binding response OmpR family regulator